MSKEPEGSSNIPWASSPSPSPRPQASIDTSGVTVGEGIARSMGIAVTPRRCAFAARALRMRSSCCVFLTTLSGNGPGQRGSR
eukprot:5905701-Pleurochrysis_carterae.AAC.1